MKKLKTNKPNKINKTLQYRKNAITEKEQTSQRSKETYTVEMIEKKLIFIVFLLLLI